MRNIRLLILALLILGLGTSYSWARQVYKWVDENGQVHYGDTPANNTIKQLQSLEVQHAAPPGSSPPPSAGTDNTSAKDSKGGYGEQLKQKKEERLKNKAKAAEEKKKQDQLNAECKEMRDHLQNMQEGMRLVKRDDKGERVFQSEEQRATDIAATKARIQERCK